MKIAGINKEGRNKGEPIELDAKAKAVEALKMAVVENPLRTDCMNWVSDVKMDAPQSYQKGDALKGKWVNNDYHVSGSAICHFRHLTSDTLRQAKPFKFELQFHDALDDMGMPDIKIDKFNIVD